MFGDCRIPTLSDKNHRFSSNFPSLPPSDGFIAMLKPVISFISPCAFCREVVPTKPFTNTALYYKMMLESEPTPLATKWFGGFYDGSKANVGHYKMTLRNHFVVKTGCNEES